MSNGVWFSAFNFSVGLFYVPISYLLPKIVDNVLFTIFSHILLNFVSSLISLRMHTILSFLTGVKFGIKLFD